MSKVKKQHYVPKFYLSRWSLDSNSDQVYVYNKEHRRSYKANLKDVASSKYFYDYPKLDEEQKKVFINSLKQEKKLSKKDIDEYLKLTQEQFIEKAFGELESYNAPIIEKVIGKVENFKALPIHYFLKHKIFDQVEIEELSYFIAMQHQRTEEMRMVIEQMMKHFLKHFSDVTLLHIDNVAKDQELKEKMGEEDFNHFVESVKTGKFTKDSYTIEINKDFTKLMHIQSMFESIEKIAFILRQYKWILLLNQTEVPFLTSDSPVVKKANLNHPFYSNGFISKGIEVIFPISPKYAINIIEPEYLKEKAPELFDRTIFDLTRENVIHYNDYIIQQSTSQIYSKFDNFEWVEKRLNDTPEIGSKNRARIRGNK